MSIIGVDVGGTHIKTGIVQDDLKVRFRDERPTPAAAQDIVNAVYEMVNMAWRRAPGAAVGISFAGTWDNEGCVTANQLRLKKAPVRQMLRDAFGRPVPVENDAVCALMAEHRYGALKGCETGILLTLGTGIGGGVIAHGQPLRGHQGLHGELGHMITHPGGHPCGCGQKGCWEQYAAARALGLLAAPLTTRELVDRVRKGERSDVWQQYICEVTVGIQSLLMIFMPEVIAIGGGLSNAGSIVVDTIREAVEETSAYRIYCPFTRVIPASFRNDAGIIGAVALAEGAI
ncbi:MAG TPA: ROK family protein [Clostridia bacterium]|jgi:glucokinase|nr:ROK family protein [Clostridia bacterium]HQA96534.1 ROK family protein [Clostridia bacterium]HQO56194.1 ROK family protein [Clostridia bacterium]HUM60028.1 ROK family protein [Clostridia bacterium]